MTRAGLFTLVVVAGCASAQIEGGVAVRPGAEPPGVPVATWKFDDCRDASGGSVPSIVATVRLIRKIDGKLVLTEAKDGYDTVVVDNGFQKDEAQVFQVRTKTASSAFALREYRLPLDMAGIGRFALVTEVQSWNEEGTGVFRATYAKAALGCALVRV